MGSPLHVDYKYHDLYIPWWLWELMHPQVVLPGQPGPPVPPDPHSLEHAQVSALLERLLVLEQAVAGGGASGVGGGLGAVLQGFSTRIAALEKQLTAKQALQATAAAKSEGR